MEQALKEVWSQGFPGPQCAFKNLMIYKALQFTLNIAIRYALHRFRSRDIHRQELSLVIFRVM